MHDNQKHGVHIEVSEFYPVQVRLRNHGDLKTILLIMLVGLADEVYIVILAVDDLLK
jgi:hypothetical protein